MRETDETIISESISIGRYRFMCDLLARQLSIINNITAAFETLRMEIDEFGMNLQRVMSPPEMLIRKQREYGLPCPVCGSPSTQPFGQYLCCLDCSWDNLPELSRIKH